MAAPLHRGPGKEGKRNLTIRISQQEWEELVVMADRNMRSAASQARWIIARALASERGTATPGREEA